MKKEIDLFTLYQQEIENKKLNTKFPTYKTSVNKWKKDLLKAGKIRPVLGYANNVDGVQITTDTFICFMLNEGNHLDIEQCPTDIIYPDVREFVPDATKGFEVKDLDFRQYEEKPLGNKKMKYTKLNHNGIDVIVDHDKLKTVLGILGKDFKCYTFGNMRPVLFVSDKGKAILCPVRFE